MGDVELLEQIETNLMRGINNVRGSRDFYRRGSWIQIVATAALSATTTLLIGLNAIYHRTLLVAISLGTAGLTTVATAFTSWFSFRKLWINNTTALVKLYALRDRIDYDKARDGQPATDTVNDYREQLDGIFTELNTNWARIREES